MTENELIIDIARATKLIGKLTHMNFLNSYETNDSIYGNATEFESEIYGLFIIDYFLHSKPVPSNLRQKYFESTIDDIAKRHSPVLTNNNLSDLAELRFNEYADIIEKSDDKWQQPINEYLEVNIKGTKGKKTVSEVYPIDFMGMGIMEDMEYKMAFIHGQVQNTYRASKIAEEFNKGNNLDTASKSIMQTEKRHNPKQKKKGCYVATMVYGNYNAPEVLILRDYRDKILEQRLLGRLFIKLYYAISPTFVKIFNNNKMVNSLSKTILDKFVNKLK